MLPHRTLPANAVAAAIDSVRPGELRIGHGILCNSPANKSSRTPVEPMSARTSMLTEALSARLVAHRGDQDGGVENTLAAFSRAAAHGALFAECDIQFTRDLVPVVLHDNRLNRLCHRPGVQALNTDLPELTAICSPHFDLLTLHGLLNWLNQQPAITLFIEIKPPILKRIGSAAVLKLLTPLLPEHLMHRIVLISSNAGILDACSKAFSCRRGWVATRHRPPVNPISHVFIPYADMHRIPYWQAKGIKVGVYTVNDADLARTLLAKGADLIETNHFARMADELG